MDKYNVTELIGEGSFGRVFRATEKKTGQTVALKLIPKVGHSDREISSLRSEFKIQKELSHLNIVRILDGFETEKELISVAEYVPGELYRLFDQYKLEMGYRRLPEERVKELCGDLLSALYYLHSNRILHRDIKPQNILLDKEGRAKLCDFGFARNLGINTHVLTSIKGTPLYMAPELIEEKPYDHTADIWSLGCIVYELLCGQPPFSTTSLFQLIRKIRYESIQWPAHLSPESRSFLQGVLEKESRRRLTWPHLAHHDFVKGKVSVETGTEIQPLTVTLSESQELAKEIQRQDKSKLLSGNSETLIRAAHKHEAQKQKLAAALQRDHNLAANSSRLKTGKRGSERRRFSDVGQASSNLLLGKHAPDRRMSDAVLPGNMMDTQVLRPLQPLTNLVHPYLNPHPLPANMPASGVTPFKKFPHEAPASRPSAMMNNLLSPGAAGITAHMFHNIRHNVGQNIGQNVGQNIGPNVGQNMGQDFVQNVGQNTGQKNQFQQYYELPQARFSTNTMPRPHFPLQPISSRQNFGGNPPFSHHGHAYDPSPGYHGHPPAGFLAGGWDNRGLPLSTAPAVGGQQMPPAIAAHNVANSRPGDHQQLAGGWSPAIRHNAAPARAITPNNAQYLATTPTCGPTTQNSNSEQHVATRNSASHLSTAHNSSDHLISTPNSVAHLRTPQNTVAHRATTHTVYSRRQNSAAVQYFAPTSVPTQQQVLHNPPVESEAFSPRHNQPQHDKKHDDLPINAQVANLCRQEDDIQKVSVDSNATIKNADVDDPESDGDFDNEEWSLFIQSQMEAALVNPSLVVNINFVEMITQPFKTEHLSSDSISSTVKLLTVPFLYLQKQSQEINKYLTLLIDCQVPGCLITCLQSQDDVDAEHIGTLVSFLLHLVLLEPKMVSAVACSVTGSKLFTNLLLSHHDDEADDDVHHHRQDGDDVVADVLSLLTVLTPELDLSVLPSVEDLNKLIEDSNDPEIIEKCMLCLVQVSARKSAKSDDLESSRSVEPCSSKLLSSTVYLEKCLPILEKLAVM